MSKKFYPIISILLFVIIIAIGYVATSSVLLSKTGTAKLSTESKSVLVSSSSQKSLEISSSSSSLGSSLENQPQITSTPSNTKTDPDPTPVDDGWVRVDPVNPSSDVNQIRG